METVESETPTNTERDDTASPEEAPLPKPHRTAWTALTGVLGAIGGVTPHVLHHVGPLVGTALVAGAGGTALFGVLGLVASVPLLIKLRRRFSSWWAPAFALTLFTSMFLFSSLVIGPRISGRSEPVQPGVTDIQHEQHGHQETPATN